MATQNTATEGVTATFGSTSAAPISPLARAASRASQGGWQVRKVRVAVAALWPTGIPEDLLTVQERNEAISAWLKSKGVRHRPSIRTIRRALGGR